MEEGEEGRKVLSEDFEENPEDDGNFKPPENRHFRFAADNCQAFATKHAGWRVCGPFGRPL